MKLSVLALLASGLCAGAAFAQTATTTPPSSPGPAATDTTAAAPAVPVASPASSKPKAKEVVAECRDQVKNQALKGDARKEAVRDCVVKQRPDLAAWEKCRTDPRMKGKDKDERKSLMKECLKNNKG